jgi:hypothetical protein
MSLAFKAHHKLHQESSKRDTCLIRLLGHASLLETILDSNREKMDCDTVEVIAPQDLMVENDYPQLPLLTVRSYDPKADDHPSSEPYYICCKPEHDCAVPHDIISQHQIYVSSMRTSFSGGQRDNMDDKTMTFTRVRYIDSLNLGTGNTNTHEKEAIGNGMQEIMCHTKQGDSPKLSCNEFVPNKSGLAISSLAYPPSDHNRH